jgi:hypothetical protein
MCKIKYLNNYNIFNIYRMCTIEDIVKAHVPFLLACPSSFDWESWIPYVNNKKNVLIKKEGNIYVCTIINNEYDIEARAMQRKRTIAAFRHIHIGPV